MLIQRNKVKAEGEVTWVDPYLGWENRNIKQLSKEITPKVEKHNANTQRHPKNSHTHYAYSNKWIQDSIILKLRLIVVYCTHGVYYGRLWIKSWQYQNSKRSLPQEWLSAGATDRPTVMHSTILSQDNFFLSSSFFFQVKIKKYIEPKQAG